LLRRRQLNALIESRRLIVTRSLDVARFTPGFDIDNSGANDISLRSIACVRGAAAAAIHPDDTAVQMRGLAFNPDERKCDATTRFVLACRAAGVRGGAVPAVFFRAIHYMGIQKKRPRLRPICVNAKVGAVRYAARII
jgi:hypothetical protein